jgi:hypothetical protein
LRTRSPFHLQPSTRISGCRFCRLLRASHNRYSTNVPISRDLIDQLRADLPTATCDALSTRIDQTILRRLRTEFEPISHAIKEQKATSALLLDSMGAHVTSQVDARRAVETSLADNIGTLQVELQLLRTTIQTSSSIIKQSTHTTLIQTKGALVSQNALHPRERIRQS